MSKQISKELILIVLKSYFNCIEKVEETKLNINYNINNSKDRLLAALTAQWGTSTQSLLENLKIKVDKKNNSIETIHLDVSAVKYLSNEYSYETLTPVPEIQINRFFNKKIIKIYDSANKISDNDFKDYHDFIGGILQLQKWEKNQVKKIVFNNSLIFIIIGVVIVVSIIGMCDGGTYYRGVRVN